MKTATILSVIITLFLIACSGQSIDKAKEIDTFVAHCYEAGLFSGSVLVATGGKVIYKEAYGYANLELKRQLSTSTAFYLASVSKQFTTMAIMILKEQGRLSYDDNLKMFFPDFSEYAKNVSIRHMMTHTSGLPDHYSIITKKIGITNQDVLETLENQSELYFDPGTRYHYSNGAYVLLSLIVEKVSGQPFPLFMKENIFDPLNMTRTLVYDQTKPNISNRAIGYNLYGKKRDYTHFTSGAGGMYTTIEDLFKWDRALYGTDLVSMETIEEAYAPYIMTTGGSNEYGFGWEIHGGESGKIVAHSGGLAGYSTYIERYLGSENTIIFLSNRGIPMPWLMEGIRNILNNQPADLPIIPVSLKMDQVINKSGIDRAVELYKSIMTDKNNAYDFSESVLHAYGYYLLSENRLSDAIEIFKCNLLSYPDSPNAYDSLGEAYETNGQFEEAAQYYSEALKIEKSNRGEDAALYKSNLDRVIKKLGES